MTIKIHMYGNTYGKTAANKKWKKRIIKWSITGETEKQTLKRLYKQKKSLSILAHYLKIPKSTLYTRMNILKISLNSPGGVNNPYGWKGKPK